MSEHPPSDDVGQRLDAEALAFRYVDCVNRRRPDLLGDVFAPDGEWHLPGLEPVVGLEAVMGAMTALLETMPHVVQMLQGGFVEVDRGTGRGRWYVTEWGREAGGKDVFLAGVYDDDLVRLDTGWRFARRRFHLLYRGWHGPVGKFYPPAP